MAATEERPFVEYLPAVLREDEVDGENFLGRFLAAFESLQDEIQQEVRHVPELFTVTPTPIVFRVTSPEERVLYLDSAAGLRPGDVLRLPGRDAEGNAVPEENEFVEVAAIRYRHIRRRLWEPLLSEPGIDPSIVPELLPDRVTLRRAPRYAHPKWTPVEVLGGPEGPASSLADPVGAGETSLTLFDPLEVDPGNVLRIGAGAQADYAEVFSVEPGRVRVRPPFRLPHGVTEPVVRLSLAEPATPTRRFPWAQRGGAELVVTALALEGESRLELDTVTGLAPGDVLQIRDLDPERIEFVRVAALPRRGEYGPGVPHGGIKLERPLTYSHEPGVAVTVLGRVAGGTVLQAAARRDRLTVADAVALDPAPGDALAVGRDAPEYVQVLSVAGDRLSVAPALAREHPPGQPVVRVAPKGAGRPFISWLAGWLGLALRPDRGERWNRELIRRVGQLWPWRGTRVELEAFLDSYVAGEADARIRDPASPLQIGLFSRVGDDTVICGGLPHYFVADLETERRASGLYTLTGLSLLVQAAQDALRRDKPAHTYYDLRVNAHTMQIGVDPIEEIGARVGRTTLLWSEPLVIRGEH